MSYRLYGLPGLSLLSLWPFSRSRRQHAEDLSSDEGRLGSVNFKEGKKNVYRQEKRRQAGGSEKIG